MFLTLRRTPPPFMPAQPVSGPVEALPALPGETHPTDAEQRLAAALLAVVMHSQSRFIHYRTGKLCRATPVDVLTRASDLLDELGY